MSQELPFDPLPFVADPHHQTIISSFIHFLFDPASDRQIVNLSDGDKLSLEISTPAEWKPQDPTIVMLHGLCGSHKSPYLVRMVNRLCPLGYRVVRINMRNCGSGKGLARHMYHGGRSDDVFEAIKHLKKQTPQSPFVLIGFSLGGNIVLKLGGELGDLGGDFLSGLIAISPPADLCSSVIMLGKPGNTIYEKYFIRLMCADVHYRHKKFKDLPRVHLPKDLKIYEFDQMYTAPQYGFRNAQDYYDKCSAIPLIPDISVPCKVLLSEDDPIVSPDSLDYVHLPDNVSVFKTKHGGHMGYLANPVNGKGLYWLDSVLMDWISEMFKV